MSRVVVTGGSGFLGSHLCEALLARGDQVVCVDDLSTGNLENIRHLRSDDGFEFIRHNVSNHIGIDGPVDRVLHFASPASPKDYLEMPIQTLKVGSLGTHNALGLAKEKGARFLLASTSGALVIAFRVGVADRARQAAEREGIDVVVSVNTLTQ